MASANTHKQQRSCDCVHQRIHPAMWWHCRNNCQDELPIVSSAQLIPNVEHVRELFVHERNVDQLFGVEDSNPSFPPLTTVFKWHCEGRAGGGLGVQATKQHGACLLHCSIFLSTISFFVVVWFLGFDTPILVRTNATQKKLNCWINDVFYSTLCSTFPCWELIWYPKNQQNTGENNTVLTVRTGVP